MADNPQTPEEMREFMNTYMRSLREQDDVYLSLKRTTAKLNAAFEDLKKAEDENTNALDKSSDAYKKEMAARTQLDQSIKRSVNTYIQDQQRIKKAKKDDEITAAESKRLLAENGTLYWFGGSKKIAYTQIIFDKYFGLVNNLVWEKAEADGLFDERQDVEYQHQYMWHY